MRKKRGWLRAKRCTIPVGDEFVLRYVGKVPAGWEVVRTVPEGIVIRRVAEVRDVRRKVL